jgi:hypothetical protein
MSRVQMLVVAVVAAAAAAPAAAQPPPSPPRVQPRELTFGAIVSAPASLGTSSAALIRADGSPLELFRTRNRSGAWFGVEAMMTFPLTSRLAVEGAGSWSRGDLESRIEGDFEGATLVTATTPLSRFGVEGGALVSLVQRPRLAWFVRGSAGWMRELSSGNVIAENGVIGNVGTGVKYWWQPPAANRRAWGVRVEARAHARSNGVAVGEDKLRVAGVVFGGLIVGW